MAIMTNKKPFWSDSLMQDRVARELEGILEKTEAWWVLLMAPSKLIKVGIPFPLNKSLWGHTHEGQGEAVGEALAPADNSNIAFLRGLVFHLLRINPGLRKEVLKALLKEQVDGVPLEEQGLYEKLID